MFVDPGLDPLLLARVVRDGWAVEVTDVVFIPSLDMRAASYEARGPAGRWFLKVRLGSGATPIDGPLAVARGLVDRGIANVVGPLATRRGALFERVDDERSCELYPFVDGRRASHVGMGADRWRAFGRTLRASTTAISTHGSSSASPSSASISPSRRRSGPPSRRPRAPRRQQAGDGSPRS